MSRILIIADDAAAREAALLALESGHEVFAMPGPPDGPRGGTDALLRMVESMGPDLLLVDLDVLSKRGRGHGARISQALAARPQGAVAVATPSILVLIQQGREDQIIPSFEAGADDYATKPVEASELRFKVDLLLKSREKPTPQPHAAAVGVVEDDDDPDSSDAELPRALGRYVLEGRLGRGGYGVVYRARDAAKGNRPVALKVLPLGMNGNTEAVARFFRESAAIARLDHPNIVKFYELGSSGGRFFFTMEVVQGTTLKTIVDQEAPVPETRAAAFILQGARALAALSSLGFVHRDVKPENLLVAHDGTLKLIDFGLVKIQDTASITSQDDVLGTPYFMAPEYISAERKPDPRYDIYSLGVTFYNLLTGEYPFEGRNAAHVMEKHLREPPPRPSAKNPRVTARCDALVLRMLEKSPERRPQSARELEELLRPLLAPPPRY